MMDLKTKFDGLTLANPLMPAAGPLVGDAEKMLFMKEAGCGAIVSKTISTRDAHIPKPCIYGDREYVMNSELWSEYPKEMWIDRFLPEFKAKNDGRPLIVSVGYTKEDMEVLIPLLDPFADAFEVSTHYVGTDLSVVAATVAAIRRHTQKPIYMKISPHIPHPELFAKTIKENGANGVVAVNSLGPTMKIDIASRSVKYANDKGFVWTSGPVIKNLALATVYTIKTAEPSLTVIGVGGIASAEDVVEFLLAGASAVQMLSAALIRGKQLYAKIIADLPMVLEKYGFKSIQDVIDTQLHNPVKYEAELPKLIPEKCTRCLLCVKVCPYFAIEMKDQITFDPEKCFRCGLCVSKCPTKAITME
jgi:dihydroorotate dehydrogenase (fumarate)